MSTASKPVQAAGQPDNQQGRLGLTATLRRLFAYAYRSKLLLAIAVLLLAGKLTLDIGIAAVQQLFINTINGGDMDALVRLILICLGASVLLIGSFMVHFFCRQLAESRMVRELSVKLFAKTGRLPFSRIQTMHSGDLLSRNNTDTGKAMAMVGNILFDLGYNLLLCVVAFLYLANMDFWLALLALCSGPVVFFSGRFFDSRLRRISEVILAKEAEVRGLLQEVLQGNKVVRAFGMEDTLLARYVAEREELNKLLLKRTVWNGLLWKSSELVNNVVMVSCAVLIGYSAINGRMTAGEVLAFVILIGRVQWPFVGMSKTWGGVQEALGAAKRVFEVLAMPSENEAASRSEGQAELQPQAGYALQMTGVALPLPGEQEEGALLFADFNLSVTPGETVAVVGASGSGKTTLARMVCGLFQPVAGSIHVAGISLTDELDLARRQITYVPQAPYLFSGTIRANIAFGVDEATEEEIREAARLAGADGFITRLADGYDTVIGEHGSTLSGGERQRIAIARAFLRQAPLLILDEATSALDNESEQLIQESLDRLMAGRTTLVIAHRLSTVRNATRIVVMEAGQIIEEGTHEELLERGGRYHALYKVQFREAESDEDDADPEGEGERERECEGEAAADTAAIVKGAAVIG